MDSSIAKQANKQISVMKTVDSANGFPARVKIAEFLLQIPLAGVGRMQGEFNGLLVVRRTGWAFRDGNDNIPQ